MGVGHNPGMTNPQISDVVESNSDSGPSTSASTSPSPSGTSGTGGLGFMGGPTPNQPNAALPPHKDNGKHGVEKVPSNCFGEPLVDGPSEPYATESMVMDTTGGAVLGTGGHNLATSLAMQAMQNAHGGRANEEMMYKMAKNGPNPAMKSALEAVMKEKNENEKKKLMLPPSSSSLPSNHIDALAAANATNSNVVLLPKRAPNPELAKGVTIETFRENLKKIAKLVSHIRDDQSTLWRAIMAIMAIMV